MNTTPLTHLGEMPIEQFLAEYWQKKPLLIRQALPGFESPVSPDELAGLALEEEIESRLIEEQREEETWSLRSGPFTEQDFAQLPESHWTLLVQAADQWVDEIGGLLDQFRFVPNWRLDDIMVSYASDQGSVGPHFDYYDVFLLQGHGQRLWQVGPRCDSESPLLENTPLSILKTMEVSEEYTLNPGDILYVPPQYAHHGRAIGESITYSIGFRAPSEADILSDFALEVASQLSADQRYSDPNIQATRHSGEIPKDTIEQLQHIISNRLNEPKALADWFGRFMTQRKYPDLEISEDAGKIDAAELQEILADGAVLLRHPASRFAWHQHSTQDLRLFVDGEDYACSEALALTLCGQAELAEEDLQGLEDSEQKLLVELLLNGSLYLD